MRTMLLTLAVITMLLLGALLPHAQDHSDAPLPHGEVPTLTMEQKLTLQVKYLSYENARLKLEAVQGDLLTYVKSLERDGYTLDIGSATYQPVKK